MIEAYRLVCDDGYIGFWHTSQSLIDYMVYAASLTDKITLERREFGNDKELEDAHYPYTS